MGDIFSDGSTVIAIMSVNTNQILESSYSSTYRTYSSSSKRRASDLLEPSHKYQKNDRSSRNSRRSSIWMTNNHGDEVHVMSRNGFGSEDHDISNGGALSRTPRLSPPLNGQKETYDSVPSPPSPELMSSSFRAPSEIPESVISDDGDDNSSGTIRPNSELDLPPPVKAYATVDPTKSPSVADDSFSRSTRAVSSGGDIIAESTPRAVSLNNSALPELSPIVQKSPMSPTRKSSSEIATAGRTKLAVPKLNLSPQASSGSPVSPTKSAHVPEHSPRPILKPQPVILKPADSPKAPVASSTPKPRTRSTTLKSRPAMEPETASKAEPNPPLKPQPAKKHAPTPKANPVVQSKKEVTTKPVAKAPSKPVLLAPKIVPAEPATKIEEDPNQNVLSQDLVIESDEGSQDEPQSMSEESEDEDEVVSLPMHAQIKKAPVTPNKALVKPSVTPSRFVEVTKPQVPVTKAPSFTEAAPDIKVAEPVTKPVQPVVKSALPVPKAVDTAQSSSKTPVTADPVPDTKTAPVAPKPVAAKPTPRARKILSKPSGITEAPAPTKQLLGAKPATTADNAVATTPKPATAVAAKPDSPAVAKLATPAATKSTASVPAEAAAPVASKIAAKPVTPAASKVAAPVAPKTAAKTATPAASTTADKPVAPAASKAAAKSVTPAASKTAAKDAAKPVTPAAPKAAASVATKASKAAPKPAAPIVSKTAAPAKPAAKATPKAVASSQSTDQSSSSSSSSSESSDDDSGDDSDMSQSPEPTKVLRAVNTPVTAKGTASIEARKQMLQQAAAAGTRLPKLAGPVTHTAKPSTPAGSTPTSVSSLAAAAAASPSTSTPSKFRVPQPRRIAGLGSLSALVSRSVPDVHEQTGAGGGRVATQAYRDAMLRKPLVIDSGSSSGASSSDDDDSDSDSSSDDSDAEPKGGVPKGKIGGSQNGARKKPRNSGFMGLLKEAKR